MTLKSRTRRAGIGIAVIVLLLPLAFVLTLLSFPFWRWLEDFTGLESFGHHGPAEWCYWVIYGLLLVVAGLAILMQRNSR